MRKIVFWVIILIVFISTQTTPSQTISPQQIVPGEQAPPADQGKRNFGGFQSPVGQQGKQPPMTMRPRPEREIRTVSLEEISLSDPYIYPDDSTDTYHLTGTGGRLYKSKDLKMWTGPSANMVKAKPEFHEMNIGYASNKPKKQTKS